MYYKRDKHKTKKHPQKMKQQNQNTNRKTPGKPHRSQCPHGLLPWRSRGSLPLPRETSRLWMAIMLLHGLFGGLIYLFWHQPKCQMFFFQVFCVPFPLLSQQLPSWKITNTPSEAAVGSQRTPFLNCFLTSLGISTTPIATWARHFDSPRVFWRLKQKWTCKVMW